ncbi:MFS transporter [Hyphomonas sp.]|uniref:MFS transporter n=1 Tax=Hyphomonas sp. TaxID=87 RepID=UPI003561ADB4
MSESTANVAFDSKPATGTHPGGRLALVLLTLIGTINFVDRQLLAVLVEPILQDLHFSDTVFGLLTGLCFALFYATMGVPVAMVADRVNRVRLVAAACTVWSIFSGACGLATSFWQLAFARFGVGIGEAGGTAPSLSILADYYPPEKRPAVIGMFTVNGPLGVFIGISFGGWAAAQFGWRGAFFMVAILGVCLAPLLLLLVREPKRGATETRRVAEDAPALSLASTVRLFLRLPTLRLLLLGSGASAFVSYGLLNWIPAYLMREAGMSLPQLSAWFGPAAGICMGIGIWGGGTIVNIGARKSLTAYAWAPAIAILVGVPVFIMALFVPGWPLALALMLLPMICITIYVAPALALVQNLAPLRARATATALLLLAFNIVGLGLGPLSIGIVSDLLSAAGVAHSLRWALLCTAPAALVAGVAYILMARTIVADSAATVKEQAL